MSYSTLDRFGGIRTTYEHKRENGAGINRTWWPDYGPGAQDFSYQRRSHPSEAMFENLVEPGTWNAKGKRELPKLDPVAAQFRNPEPARHAMLHPEESEAERRTAAHEATERKAALRRMEVRQKKIDSWLGDAPIRMTSASLYGDAPPQGQLQGQLQSRSRSLGSVGALSSVHASSVSRDVYEKHGFLVGRSQGSIADGRSGEAPRRHNPLSFHAMLFSGSLQDSRNAKLRDRVRKPSKEWRTTPENRFVFDPRSFLPVPRGAGTRRP